MKKKTTLFISIILVFCLAACGADNNRSAPNEGLVCRNQSNMDNTSEISSELSAENVSTAAPGDGNTVLSAAADAHNSQTLYLWEEGNAPAVTEYSVNNGRYADNPDFRPYLVTFPVPEGIEVKGAVLICAGGAFNSEVTKWKELLLPKNLQAGAIRVLW